MVGDDPEQLVDLIQHFPMLASDNLYAGLSLYVRAQALHVQGGVYCDTDVELKSSLEGFLDDRAFSGFEVPGSLFRLFGRERLFRLNGATRVEGADVGRPRPRDHGC